MWRSHLSEFLVATHVTDVRLVSEIGSGLFTRMACLPGISSACAQRPLFLSGHAALLQRHPLLLFGQPVFLFGQLLSLGHHLLLQSFNQLLKLPELVRNR